MTEGINHEDTKAQREGEQKIKKPREEPLMDADKR